MHEGDHRLLHHTRRRVLRHRNATQVSISKYNSICTVLYMYIHMYVVCVCVYSGTFVIRTPMGQK